MSLQDFCSYTPSEFRAVYDAWRKQRDYDDRESWEQTRRLCVSILQPWSKKALTGRDVFSLPWDKSERKEEQLSEDERKARYEAAKKRYRIEE